MTLILLLADVPFAIENHSWRFATSQARYNCKTTAEDQQTGYCSINKICRRCTQTSGESLGVLIRDARDYYIL